MAGSAAKVGMTERQQAILREIAQPDQSEALGAAGDACLAGVRAR